VVCGEAASGRECYRKGRATAPAGRTIGACGARDKRFDYRPPAGDARGALILFTGHGNLFKSDEASSAGIDAVFSKTEPFEELLDQAKRLVKQVMA
jgi:hypothetical protein